MKPLQYKTWHPPTTSSTLHRTPHPNNKEDKNTNPIISRQTYHFTQPCPSEKKKILSTNIILNEAYTYHGTNLRRAETTR